MGIFDELKKITRPYDDEYFDDYEDAEEQVYEEPEEEPAEREAPRVSRREFVAKVERAERRPQRREQPARQPVSAAGQSQVVLFKPERFEAASEAADHLRDRRAVVLNLEQTDKDVARRLIDFLSGVTYALDGKIQKIAANTYILTPRNIDLTGDIAEELESGGLYF